MVKLPALSRANETQIKGGGRERQAANSSCTMQMPLFGTTECRISITGGGAEGLFISWSRFFDSHTLPPLPAEALPRAAAALNGCEHARSRNREGDKRTRQEMNSGQKASADRISRSLYTQPGRQKPPLRCGQFDTKGREWRWCTRCGQVTICADWVSEWRAVENCRRRKQIALLADVSNFSQLVRAKGAENDVSLALCTSG